MKTIMKIIKIILYVMALVLIVSLISRLLSSFSPDISLKEEVKNLGEEIEDLLNGCEHKQVKAQGYVSTSGVFHATSGTCLDCYKSGEYNPVVHSFYKLKEGAVFANVGDRCEFCDYCFKETDLDPCICDEPKIKYVGVRIYGESGHAFGTCKVCSACNRFVD